VVPVLRITEWCGSPAWVRLRVLIAQTGLRLRVPRNGRKQPIPLGSSIRGGGYRELATVFDRTFAIHQQNRGNANPTRLESATV